jgi:aspartate-semialdehyde dehydrogenase
LELPTPLPDRVASMSLQSVAEDLPCRIVFSALDAAVAREVESPALGRENLSSPTRPPSDEPDVPLLIPEINLDSLLVDPSPATFCRDGRAPS